MRALVLLCALFTAGAILASQGSSNIGDDYYTLAERIATNTQRLNDQEQRIEGLEGRLNVHTRDDMGQIEQIAKLETTVEALNWTLRAVMLVVLGLILDTGIRWARTMKNNSPNVPK